jgi:hypothetical protein
VGWISFSFSFLFVIALQADTHVSRYVNHVFRTLHRQNDGRFSLNDLFVSPRRKPNTLIVKICQNQKLKFLTCQCKRNSETFGTICQKSIPIFSISRNKYNFRVPTDESMTTESSEAFHRTIFEHLNR